MPKNRNPHHVPTVLVANRGEIAVRVFRTVKRMGLRSAAVYSEDASFGRAVEAAGLAFVGPPPDVLAAMGGKDEAKRIAEAAGVPVLPGYGGGDQDDAALE